VQRGIVVLLIEDVHWADRCNQSEERHVERGARSSRNLYEIRRTRTYGEVAEWLNAAVLKCLQLTSTGPRKYHLSHLIVSYAVRKPVRRIGFLTSSSRRSRAALWPGARTVLR
jgi:hypothetical protein